MNFTFSEQQQVAADALDQMLVRFRGAMVHEESFLPGTELDAELEASGFHEIAADEDLGEISAVDLIIRVANVAPVVEVAASTLVRHRLCPDAPRPLALVSGDRPVRFGAEAKTALIDTGDAVLRLDVQPGDFVPLDTLFAYPYARLSDAARQRAAPVEANDALSELRRTWRIGLAAEITGAIDAGLRATIDHVTQRKQFGQPIGAFQAIHHRLAEVAVQLESIRWLTFKAAGSSDPVDAALAAGQAQAAIRQAAYDFHQFHGAMGLTLEHPLHLWSYRLKALAGEMGGWAQQFDAAAAGTWG
jgi:hypothetical protein